MAWEAADVKKRGFSLWFGAKINAAVVIFSLHKQQEDALLWLNLNTTFCVCRVHEKISSHGHFLSLHVWNYSDSKGENVTRVSGEIRDINICSISGSVYMSSVREATVMSLCSLWTTPIMLWLSVIPQRVILTSHWASGITFQSRWIHIKTRVYQRDNPTLWAILGTSDIFQPLEALLVFIIDFVVRSLALLRPLGELEWTMQLLSLERRK